MCQALKDTQALSTYRQAFCQEKEILGLEITVADTACMHIPRRWPKHLRLCDATRLKRWPVLPQCNLKQKNLWAQQLLTYDLCWPAEVQRKQLD